MKLRRSEMAGTGVSVDKRQIMCPTVQVIVAAQLYRYQLNRYGKESNAQTLDLEMKMADSSTRGQVDNSAHHKRLDIRKCRSAIYCSAQEKSQSVPTSRMPPVPIAYVRRERAYKKLPTHTHTVHTVRPPIAAPTLPKAPIPKFFASINCPT
jgi:hypothetical protein